MITHRYLRFNFVLFLAWLRSPLAIMISVILAIYVGSSYPKFAMSMSPIGEVYLGLLKMCVLPILLSAITGSVGRLMGSQDAKRYIRRMAIAFLASLLLVSCFASLMASISGPGKNLSAETLSKLGVLVNTSGIDLEISLNSSSPTLLNEQTELSLFLNNLIPENIFSALSEGNTLKVLCFSIIFGVSLGLLNKRLTESFFIILDSIFKSFNQLMQWLTLLLPFGLFSLLSYQLSKQGLEIVTLMFNFILVTIATFFAIYAAGTIVIWQKARLPFMRVISALREPSILSLATSSSFSCLPSAISTLSEKLKFDRQTINLVTPLALTLCRFGSVTYFALASIFVAQLYNKSFEIIEFIIVILCSILAGISTSGVTGILTLNMLNIVLEPLNLPVEAVLVLFIAVDPLIDPIRTLGIVHTAMAVTTVVAEIEDEADLKPNITIPYGT